jgi:sporulation protein YlmC with PRC-barrel domain
MRLSSLLNLPVSEESGRSRGRVFDVCVERKADRYVVTALVVGSHGFVQRLGIRPSGRGPNDDRDEIPWKQVVRVEKDRILIKSTKEQAPSKD